MRILGGLMALGYEIGTIMKRTSTSYSDDKVTIKLDQIEGMDRTFVQVTTFPFQSPFPPIPSPHITSLPFGHKFNTAGDSRGRMCSNSAHA